MARKSGIVGLPNLRRVLRRLPKEATEDVRVAIDYASDKLVRDARARVAARSRRISSALRKVLSGDRFTARIGIIGVRAKKLAYFARWTEFGTAPHSLKKGSRRGGRGRSASTLASQAGGWHPGVAPHPFLIPAYEANKRFFLASISSAVDRSLRRGAGKL